jgi:hypothetical protein
MLRIKWGILTNYAITYRGINYNKLLNFIVNSIKDFFFFFLFFFFFATLRALVCSIYDALLLLL